MSHLWSRKPNYKKLFDYLDIVKLGTWIDKTDINSTTYNDRKFQIAILWLFFSKVVVSFSSSSEIIKRILEFLHYY